MKNQQDFQSLIKQQIQLLNDLQKLIFAVVTAEKLHPNYIHFKNKYNWGDEAVLRNAIDFIFNQLKSYPVLEVSEVYNHTLKIELITPDTEDFSDILTSFALDACSSISSILDFLLDKNVEHIFNISTFATDTVDMYIQEKENLDPNDILLLETKIANDNFMINEKERQLNLIKQINTYQKMELKTIEQLRDGKSIIDLSLIRS